MVDLVIKLGIIGLKDFDNGHPYSFAAIINGYDKKYFKKSKFKVILNYLKLKKKKDFGFKNVKVTHAWTQNKKITKNLCKSCKIDNCLSHYQEMIGHVDAVIIARDDLHFKISKIFLKKKIPVFIDKPLTLKKKELIYYEKYLKKDLLMSTSGLRFSKEILEAKKKIKKIGKIRLINAAVINGLSKYGVHMLDMIDELDFLRVKKISRKSNNIDTINYFCEKDISINLFCLGKVSKIFNLHFVGSNGSFSINILDNFSAFKNTLEKFIKMIKNKKPELEPKKTINVLKVLISSLNKKKYA